jgi:hypothetical protein
MKVVGMRHQRIGNLIANDSSRKRDVARGHRLGEGDEVGLDAIML